MIENKGVNLVGSDAEGSELGGNGVYEGGTPPIKMHQFENKGVAGGAICKWLNGKGMDESKLGQIRGQGARAGRKKRSGRAPSGSGQVAVEYHKPC